MVGAAEVARTGSDETRNFRIERTIFPTNVRRYAEAQNYGCIGGDTTTKPQSPPWARCHWQHVHRGRQRRRKPAPPATVGERQVSPWPSPTAPRWPGTSDGLPEHVAHRRRRRDLWLSRGPQSPSSINLMCAMACPRGTRAVSTAGRLRHRTGKAPLAWRGARVQCQESARSAAEARASHHARFRQGRDGHSEAARALLHR